MLSEFSIFIKSWGIEYIIMLFYYSKVNGKVELVVKVVKCMLWKIIKLGED